MRGKTLGGGDWGEELNSIVPPRFKLCAILVQNKEVNVAEFLIRVV